MEQAWPFAQNALAVVSQVLLGLVMDYYWLTSRAQILTLLLRVSPVDRRKKIMTIWTDIEETLGAYVRGQTILSAIVFGASLVGLLLLRIPNAVALAVIAGMFEVIPLIGPFLGAIPAILVGFSVSPLTGLLITGWYLVVQQIEGNILIPRIMHKSVGLNPLVVILAVVAGGSVAGVIGALLAIPIAGAAQVLVRDLWIEPAIEENDAVAPLSQDEVVAMLEQAEL